MNVAPLFAAAMPIPPHAIAAMLALVLGGFQLRMAKGTPRHRQLGYIWTGLMAFVAISGFFIHETQVIGIFSPIHLLSVLVLLTLWQAIRQVGRGNVLAHRRAMILLYWLSLVLAGLFTFWPGRVMYHVVTGG